MRLGFAVEVLGGGGLPSHDARRHGSDPELAVSLAMLVAILAYLDDADIRMCRMATARRGPRRRRGRRDRRRPGPLRGRILAALRGRSRPGRDRERRPHLRVAGRPAGRERIGRPVVWDVLHHHCHDPNGIPDHEALRLALATWPEGVTPKVHFSSPRTAVEERRRKRGRRVERSLVLPSLRAHADLVDPIAFEAKAKDLALMRLREQLATRQIAVAAPLQR